MNDQIKDYINKSRKAGYTDDQIKEALKKSGWNDDQISEAFKPSAVSVQKNSTPAENDPLSKTQNPEPSIKKKRNTLSIIAIIFAFLLPIVGLVLSIISLIQISKRDEKGKGLAIAALVLSILMPIVYYAILTAFAVVLMGTFNEPDYKDMPQSYRDTISCGTDVDIRILNAGGDRICYTFSGVGDGVIALQLENAGIRDIIGWRIIAIGKDGTQTSDNNMQLSESEIGGLKAIINSEETGPSIDSIYIRPQIQGAPSNPVVTCSEPNLEFDISELSNLESCDSVTWDDNI